MHFALIIYAAYSKRHIFVLQQHVHILRCTCCCRKKKPTLQNMKDFASEIRTIFSLRAFFARDTTKDRNIDAETNRLKLEKKRESFSLRAFFARDTTLSTTTNPTLSKWAKFSNYVHFSLVNNQQYNL